VTLRRALAAAAALGLVAALAAGLYGRWALGPVAEEAPERAFEVPRGASLAAIAARLEREGLVRRAWAFEALARWRGAAGGLRAGEYALSPSAGAAGVLDTLASGRVVTHAVVLPEGLTAAEIATRLDAKGLAEREAFLEVVHDPEVAAALGVEGESLEGYLFPETYHFARGLTAREIADAMVEEFLAVWVPLAEKAEARGMSMRETVILASIVEKETGAPEERPLVAAVFHNRLERGMRLETDPTVIYGIEDFDGNLRRVHLEDASNPYNTYQIAGLPPGPIANPGAASLRATLEPADADYLYFVSRGDGTHVFSKTYRQHVNAVNRYQRGMR